MKKFNFWIYVIILAVVALGLFVFVKYSNALFDSLKKTETREDLVELKENIADVDYKIYWIGTVPDRLTDIKIENVTTIDERHLPLSYYTEEKITTTTNEFGKEVKNYESRDIYQDCPAKSFIVISTTGLTDEDRELFKRCSKENGTYIIVVGKEPVNEYRDYLIDATGMTTDVHSMRICYFENTKSNIFDKENAENINSLAFSQEFLTYIGDMLKPSH